MACEVQPSSPRTSMSVRVVICKKSSILRSQFSGLVAAFTLARRTRGCDQV